MAYITSTPIPMDTHVYIWEMWVGCAPKRERIGFRNYLKRKIALLSK
jgi:hypothetical protein